MIPRNVFFTACALSQTLSPLKLKNWKTVLFILLFGGIIGTASAQNKDALGFTVTFSKTNIAIGDTVEIIFKAPIPANFHVYSEKTDCPEEEGPLRAELHIDKDLGIILYGVVEGVGDQMVNDDIWKCSTGEFANVCEFRQKVIIQGEVHGLTAHFYGQRCSQTDGICYQISEDIKIPLDVSVK